MLNNEILHHIHDIFNFTDEQMQLIFTLGDSPLTQDEITNLFRKTGEPTYKTMSDEQLACFLNGLIIEKRGKKEGVQPVVEPEITNNIIFNKLKISLSLKAEDILKIMLLADLNLSKHELSAFFRKPIHKHFRLCTDATLMAFIQGLKIQSTS